MILTSYDHGASIKLLPALTLVGARDKSAQEKMSQNIAYLLGTFIAFKLKVKVKVSSMQIPLQTMS